MKKVLLTLVGLCLGIAFCFGQTSNNSPWTPNYAYEKVMLVLAVVEVDCVEQANEEIGVASFVGDECRDAALNAGYDEGHLVYVLAVSGDNGDEVTFRLWNETTGEALNLDSDFTLIFNEEGYVEDYVYITFTTPTTSGFELPITGYGEGTGNWYLIASPVGNVNPTNVTLLEGEGNMLNENGYDLFSFDQSQNGAEWRNYALSNFVLEPGKGYLYANHDDVTLVFNGEAYTGSGEVELEYDANANATGYNLVGNPFGVEAYLSVPYYKMNGDENGGTEIMTESSSEAIPAMMGVFVQATEAGTVTFSTEAPGDKSASLALNLSSGRNVIDRAIVRFDEGQQLNKFQLNPNSTKVYIPVDNEDFAVVRGESMGEMPVNFKAETNGNYTLSFTNENVEFAYLHLIDNMNGNDVDLLANPTYSFDALTTDYASRFKLVFATGNADDDFAFFSNGNFIINNEGNAMLQVVDVTGRILKSETINGCASVNVNAAPGVYMLRLINGDNMKVQKVVVK